MRAITSDRERVATILRKLLQNACRFTERGKIACEAARLRADGADAIRFRVSDTGIGMTAEQIARCFDPFYQADSSATRAQDGAGLGLTTAQRLVDTLDGDLSVQSVLGEGSEFVVTLAAE